MTKKQNQIIQHICTIPINTRVSVRLLATQLGVSQGTAYKALKKCEEMGLVRTAPRIGTIRIAAETEPIPSGEVVRDWMHAPPMLYCNDFVADYITAYGKYLPFRSYCVAVDESFRVQGSLSSEILFTSSPGTNVMGLISPDYKDVCFILEPGVTMSDAVQKFHCKQQSLAFIVENEILVGFLTVHDILRYTQKERKSFMSSQDSVLRGTVDDMYLSRLQEILQNASVLAEQKLSAVHCVLVQGQFNRLTKQAKPRQIDVEYTASVVGASICQIEVSLHDAGCVYDKITLLYTVD